MNLYMCFHIKYTKCIHKYWAIIMNSHKCMTFSLCMVNTNAIQHSLLILQILHYNLTHSAELAYTTTITPHIFHCTCWKNNLLYISVTFLRISSWFLKWKKWICSNQTQTIGILNIPSELTWLLTVFQECLYSMFSSQRGENILVIKRNLPTNGTRYQFANLFDIIKICAAYSDVFCHIQGLAGETAILPESNLWFLISRSLKRKLWGVPVSAGGTRWRRTYIQADLLAFIRRNRISSLWHTWPAY